jgi:hypothetical protein
MTFLTVALKMFRFCTNVLMGLPWGSLVMSSSRLSARKVHMQSLSLLYIFLNVKNTSADPPVANNWPIFFYKTVLNSALCDVFLTHNLFYAASGAKPVDYHRCRSLLLIYPCRNVSVCFSFRFYKELRRFARKNK